MPNTAWEEFEFGAKCTMRPAGSCRVLNERDGLEEILAGSDGRVVARQVRVIAYVVDRV